MIYGPNVNFFGHSKGCIECLRPVQKNGVFKYYCIGFHQKKEEEGSMTALAISSIIIKHKIRAANATPTMVCPNRCGEVDEELVS